MVQTGEISFAGGIAFNIKTDEAKQRILEELEQKFRFKVIQKHFERYSEATIPRLQNNPHLVTVRTNGNPYLLYLTKFNYVNQCVFIDKKVQQGYFLPRIILSKFRFHDDLFEGTLLDGEMIKDRDSKWIFMISDMIAQRGNYLDNVNVVKRLNLLYHMLQECYIYDEHDVCRFQVKKHFTYAEVETILSDFIPNLPYTCRGIYFKPLFLKFKDILMNFDDSLIQNVMRKKYKSVSNFLMLDDANKIVSSESHSSLPKIPSNNQLNGTDVKRFYIKKTSQPDVFELYDGDNKSKGHACVPTLKVSKMMRQLFLDKNVTDKLPMTCEYSEKFERYIPVALCHD